MLWLSNFGGTCRSKRVAVNEHTPPRMYSHALNLLPRKEQQRRRTDLLNYYTLVAGIVTVTGALVMAGLLLLFDQVYKVNLATLQTDKQLAESQAVGYL